jgi:hypothetical protein
MGSIQGRDGQQVEQPKPNVHQQHGDENGEVELRGKKEVADEYPHEQGES